MKINKIDCWFVLFSIFIFISQCIIQGWPVAVLTWVIGGIFLFIFDLHSQKKMKDLALRIDAVGLKVSTSRIELERIKKSIQLNN